MQKKKYIAIIGLMMLSFLCSAAFGQQPPAASLMSENNVVTLGQEFVISVHINTGTQKLGTYSMNLIYDGSLVQAVSSVAGPDGFGTLVSNMDTSNKLIFSCFDVSSKGKTGPNLNVLVIRFRSLGYGLAKFTLEANLGSDSTTLINLPPITTTVSIMELGLTYGDVNNDGNINIIDALLIAKAPEFIPVNSLLRAGDVNADRQLTIIDALLVAQYSAGIIKELPVTAGLTKKNTELVPVYYNGLPPQAVYIIDTSISVVLRDASGSLLAGKEVYFTEGYLTRSVRAVSDSYGAAKGVIGLPPETETTLKATFGGDAALMTSSCYIRVIGIPPITPTPFPTVAPTPTSTSSIISVAYHMSPQMVTISVVSSAASTKANITGYLPDPCTGMSSWGTVSRSGNTFWVDTTSTQMVGMMCIQVIADISHSYDLGALEPGDYIFNFSNWGSLLKTANFTVPNGS